MISLEAPDFSFVAIENTPNKPNFLSFSYQGGNNSPRIIDAFNKTVGGRLKANNAIWTPLEINDLMSRSMEIMAPIGSPQGMSTGIGIGSGYGAYSLRGVNPDNYYPSGVFFAPDFPEFLLPKQEQHYNAPAQGYNNAITWGVVRMENGSMSGPPFRGTQEVRPRHREYIAVFGDTNRKYLIDNSSTRISRSGKLLKFITIAGQHYDMLIQYNIWSKSNYEVELLTHWFLRYMKLYRGMYREAGVQNMFLHSRVRDDTLMQMKNGYHLRSVLYYFRVEELTIEEVGPINRINLNIDVESLLPDEEKWANKDYRQNESLEWILDKWFNYSNWRK